MAQAIQPPSCEGRPGRGGARPGAGRKAGVPNKRTVGDLDLHRWAFDHAWSGTKEPKGATMQQRAALKFHQSMVAGALRGNERAAAISVERAFGRMPQPLEHGGPQGGPLKIVEVLLSRDEPPV